MIKKKKKILFISHSIEDDDEGRNIYYIISFIDQDRYTPIVYLPAKKGILIERLKNENICKVILEKRLHPYNKPARIHSQIKLNRIFISRIISFIKNHIEPIYLTLFKLPRIIIKEKIDILYGDNTTRFITVIAGLITFTDVVHHIRNLPDKYSRIPLKIITAAPVVKKVICVTKYTLKHYPVNHKKATVIYNGIDIAEYRKSIITGQLREAFQIPNEAVVFGAAGQLSTERGYVHFIRAGKIAIDSCPNIDIRLVVIGRSLDPDEMNYFYELKGLVENLTISQNVIFLGFKSDVKPFYVDLDVLVVPSLWADPFPYELLEGMALSLPVLAYAAGGIPEIVDKDYTGLLYKPGDYINLGKGMIQLIKHKYIRTLMGAAGRDRVVKCFDAYMKTWEIEDVL